MVLGYTTCRVGRFDGRVMAWTVAITFRNGVPIWKSSSLAVMVHGLNDDVSGPITAEKLNTMENNATEYNMAMCVERQSWR